MGKVKDQGYAIISASIRRIVCLHRANCPNQSYGMTNDLVTAK